MTWEADASGRRGRQPSYSVSTIQACLNFKVLFGLPLRQTTKFIESLLNRVVLDWSVPNIKSLCRPLPGRRFESQICPEGPKNIISCHPVKGVSGAVTPIGPLSWFASKPLPGSEQHGHQSGGQK